MSDDPKAEQVSPPCRFCGAEKPCCSYLFCAHPACCGYRGKRRDTAAEQVSLTNAERRSLGDVVAEPLMRWRGDGTNAWNDLNAAVEQIVAERVAQALAPAHDLADEWQEQYDRWIGVHDGPRVQIFKAHATRLRGALDGSFRGAEVER